MKCPAHGGCINYISKRFHSLVLMAFVYSNDKFLYVNIGPEGCGSDGGAFCDTSLFKAIQAIEADQKLKHYLEGHSLYLFVSLQTMLLQYSLHDFARKQESQLNSLAFRHCVACCY